MLHNPHKAVLCINNTHYPPRHRFHGRLTIMEMKKTTFIDFFGRFNIFGPCFWARLENSIFDMNGWKKYCLRANHRTKCFVLFSWFHNCKPSLWIVLTPPLFAHVIAILLKDHRRTCFSQMASAKSMLYLISHSCSIKA